MANAPDDFDDDGLEDLADAADDADLEVDDLTSEGIFNERDNIFESKHNQADRTNHRNAGPITREAEQEQMYAVTPPAKDTTATAIAPAQGGQAKKKQLVAQYDQHGRPWVAWFHDGEQKEPFRRPERAEVQLLAQKGQITSGGVGVVDESAPAAAPGIPWKKVLIGVAFVGAVGGAAYWVYKKNKADAETDVDEVDG